MEDRSADDRRAHQRVATEFDVQGSTDGVVARMVARNLSLGGLYCTSPKDFPEMTRLAVRLLLPTHGHPTPEPQSLDVEAVVVRREPLPGANGESRFELGLFFTKLDSSARTRLAQFLSHD